MSSAAKKRYIEYIPLENGESTTSSSFHVESYVQWAPYVRHLFSQEINNAMYTWFCVAYRKKIPLKITLLIARYSCSRYIV